MPSRTDQTRTDGVEFTRLSLLRPGRRWWRPLLTALLLVVLVLLLQIGFWGTAVLFAGVDPLAPARFEVGQPFSLMLMLGPVVLLLPAVLLASRIAEGGGVGLLSSVAGRIRWGWLGRSLLVAVVVYALHATVTAVSGAAPGGGGLRLDSPGLVLSLVLIVIVGALQSTAEEFVFRGFVMQSIGSWLTHPAFAVVLQIPVFLVLHVYDVWGSLTVVAMAAFAGWLAWRTGGLESSIGLHAGNNVSILIAGALGLRDANATELTPATLGISVAAMLVYTIVVDRWADRIGLVRIRPSSATPIAGARRETKRPVR